MTTQNIPSKYTTIDIGPSYGGASSHIPNTPPPAYTSVAINDQHTPLQTNAPFVCEQIVPINVYDPATAPNSVNVQMTVVNQKHSDSYYRNKRKWRTISGIIAVLVVLIVAIIVFTQMPSMSKPSEDQSKDFKNNGPTLSPGGFH